MTPDPVLHQLADMEILLRQGDPTVRAKNAAVSQWAVAEHIDHLTKVYRTVLLLLMKEKEVQGKGINLLGRIVLLTGFIPRGRGESPAAVRGEAKTLEQLTSALEDCHDLYQRFQSTPPSVPPQLLVFPHPFFRNLTREQALKFLAVHYHHHRKIIRDILGAGA